MRFVLPAVFIVLLSAQAQAQEPSHPLRLPTLLYASAAGTDVTATYVAMRRGTAIEVNPILKGLNDRPAIMLATAASLDVAGIWAWNRFIGKTHPKLAAVGLYGMTAVRTWFAVQGVRYSVQPTRCQPFQCVEAPRP